MTAIVVGMLLCACGFARMAARERGRGVYEILAGLFLIGALSLLGLALGVRLLL